MPRSRYQERSALELSRAARVRLARIDFYHSHGQNAILTCHHFGISRQTFYRRKRHYDPENLATLEDCSH